MEIYFKNSLVGELPIKPLADLSPEYDRPSKEPSVKFKKEKNKNISIKSALIKIITSPNHSSKNWIYSQYDRSVMCDTYLSSEQSDAAIIRIHNSNKAIAVTCDCNPIYCNSNPRLGAEIGVAESWRNLIASGAEPIAITDNLNFGNPEKKEIMYQIKEAIKGIKKACEALNYPVVSGNVSLYNETKKESIFPTPVIGGVGVIKKISQAKGLKMNYGDKIFIVGNSRGHLELSEFNRICNKNYGCPPPLNLKEEIRNGTFVRNFMKKHNSIVTGCHDISEGGIILALAELSIRNAKGLKIKIPSNVKNSKSWLFGEDQSRYLLVVNSQDTILNAAKKEKIKLEEIATVYGDKFRVIKKFEISVKKLINYNNKWFKNFIEK